MNCVIKHEVFRASETHSVSPGLWNLLQWFPKNAPRIPIIPWDPRPFSSRSVSIFL